MENIGRLILKAIRDDSWLQISYNNKEGNCTKYMIGINDIDFKSKMLKVDGFNVAYSYEVQNYLIHYDGIIDAEIIDGTYHETPEELKEKINNQPENFSFLRTDFMTNELLDYYVDCYMLDTTPYLRDHTMIECIDNRVLSSEKNFDLNEEEFEQIYNFIQRNHEKRKLDEQKGYGIVTKNLVMNLLSISNFRGQKYVLAYRELKLNIKHKSLYASRDVSINKEFMLDADTKKVESKASYTRFISEEDFELFNNFYENKLEIEEKIKEYTKSQKGIVIDNTPCILELNKNVPIDLASQLVEVRKMIQNPDTMSMPFNIFFGNSSVKLSRKINYPIFVTDKFNNIDQINAINQAFKSPCSYIQGPPGTGKTKTLLNAIVTAEFNDKTVLVCSNNNIPMDGVYEDILKLRYNKKRLLFPALRLGNNDNIDSALDRIIEMYKIAENLVPNTTMIDKIKKNRKELMTGLSKNLEIYTKCEKLKRNINLLDHIINTGKDINDKFKLALYNQRDALVKQLEKINIQNEDEIVDTIPTSDEDFKNFFMAIHFDTADRLQKLKSSKYKEIYDIAYLPVDNEELRKGRVKAFREYLSKDINLKKFLDIFPIIISTNLSCTYLGEPHCSFDFVMMDEAGQCSISNALIPIVRAKQLVLIGDPQQLQPVIVLDEKINEGLKIKYNITDTYDYIKNSIYTLFSTIDTQNLETLLRYHYRCNDKIIGFSNNKYYNHTLKIKSKSDEANPLVFVDTSKYDKDKTGDKNISRIEAKYICEYIKKHPDEQIGIITPFVKQKECITSYLNDERMFNDNISIGTVHAFQGNQKKTIIFSTAITNTTHQSTYNWLKNNKELINVAVTRPQDKLVMLGSMDAIKHLAGDKDDIKELANYVVEKGKYEVTSKAIDSFALGTRNISTKVEKIFHVTISQALSVLGKRKYIFKPEIQVKSLFEDWGEKDYTFYSKSFDGVIYRREFGDEETPLCVVEFDGDEHNNRTSTILSDKMKLDLCKKHNIPLLRFKNEDCMNYDLIMSKLKKVLIHN